MGKSGSLVQEMGLAGVTAVIVVNFTHPIDTVKTRMQVNPQFSIKEFVGTEGPRALYKGISAAWLRESSYTSLKLGLYGPVKTVFGATGDSAPFYLKFAAGSTAGVVGSVLGNPFDVLKTLMITHKGKNEPLPSLVRRVYSERGIGGFYRGIQANALRACILNGTKMACYDQIKGYVVKYTGWSRKDLRTQFTSSCGAGLAMAITVSPIDFLRTQLMNQEKKVYNGLVDCFVQIVKKEGPLALYRGFIPIWSRFAPQATLQLVVFESLRSAAGMEAI